MVMLANFMLEGQQRIGVVEDGAVRPLPGSQSMLDLIERTPEEVAANVAAAGDAISLDSVTLLAPIPVPRRNVFCVGWNYVAHFEEGRKSRPKVELPSSPTFFTKTTTTVVGPFDEVSRHATLTSQLDWEVELAVVIGRSGTDIAEEDALSHVFGYTVANDVTARDVQAGHGGQWFRGKSLDGSLPMGPYLVTADEVPNPQDLDIVCEVNGTTVQSANTSQMIFPVARVIAELSRGLTLLAGDIVLSGTPEGVGHQRKPAVYLHGGDILESKIGGLGAMRNVVSA